MKLQEIIIIGLAVLTYFYYMWRNKLFRPNPVAFGIWTLVRVASVITYKDISDYWIVPLEMLILNIVTVWVAIKRAPRRRRVKLTGQQIACILLAAGALSCKYIPEVPKVVNNLAAQVAMAIGFIPLIQAALHKRHEEPVIPWLLWVVGYGMMSYDVFQLFYTLPSPWYLQYEQIANFSYPFILGVIFDGIVLVLSVRNKYRRMS